MTTKDILRLLREAEDRCYASPYEEISYLENLCQEAADEIERLRGPVRSQDKFDQADDALFLNAKLKAAQEMSKALDIYMRNSAVKHPQVYANACHALAAWREAGGE